MQISLRIGKIEINGMMEIIKFSVGINITWFQKSFFLILGISKPTKRISMKMTQRIIVEDQA